MNQEKAKELFSPYYEGTLEPGLAQALGQSLSKDPHLQAEFEQFERTYDELRALKFEVIEIPADLAERVSARIDRHIYEQKRRTQPSWVGWLRNVSIAAVASAAVFGAVLSLRHTDGNSTSANIIGGLRRNPPQEQLTITPTPVGVRLQFAPAGSQSLVIRDGLDGAERRRLDLQGESLSTTLQNKGSAPTAFGITVSNDTRVTLIALPGKVKTTEKIGDGNVEAFAKALAGYYNATVEIKVAEPNVSLTWDFEGKDPETAISKTFDSQRYTIQIMPNGLIMISDANA